MIHNLDEYKLAKRLVEELPKVIKIVDQSVTDLSKYSQHIDVVSQVWELNALSILLNAKYIYYLGIYNNGAKQGGFNVR